MPSSHLPQALSDKWVYNFPNDFSGLVGGHGLWRMHSHCLMALCNFLYKHLATPWAKPYRGCAKIVWKSCNAGAVAVQSLQNGTRRGSIQRLHRGDTVTVRGLHNRPKSLQFLKLYNFFLAQITI